MSKRSIPWSSEDDDRLRRLAEEGRGVTVIAERLKRTEGAVYRRTSTLGITLKKVAKRSNTAPNAPTAGKR